MAVRRLDESSIRKLRAGCVIGSLAQAAEELVCNSVDAGATTIKVRIHSGFSLTVEDNGHGMRREDLELAGTRYATSKLRFPDFASGTMPKSLGFKGEALYSLVSCSVVEIVTRHRASPTTYRKVMVGEELLSLAPCNPSRPIGTTVTLRDLFHNQPVRRKLYQRDKGPAFASLQARMNGLAVAFPKVSFTVTDETRGRRLLCVRHSEGLAFRVGQLCGPRRLDDLAEADVAVGTIRLRGLLQASLPRGLTSKSQQFVQVNGRPVLESVISDELNRLWKVARQGMHCADDDVGGARSYPSFFVDIQVPYDSFDVLHEVNKSRAEFEHMVEASIRQAVREVAAALWKVDAQTLHNPTTGSLRSPIRLLQTCGDPKSAGNPSPHGGAKSQPSSPTVGRRARPGTPHMLRQHLTKVPGVARSNVREIEWTTAGKGTNLGSSSVRVHASDGTLPLVRNTADFLHRSSWEKGPERETTTAKLGEAAVSRHQQPQHNLINPMQFGHVEARSNVVSREPRKSLDTLANANIPIQCAYDVVKGSSLYELTRSRLAAGCVMSQVSNKFILLKSGTGIVAIDQHAADERIRLEELRAEYVDSGKPLIPRKLSQPQALHLSTEDLTLLGKKKDLFERWGWRWTPKYLTHAACINDTYLSVEDLKAFLSQLALNAHQSHVPLSLLRLLESKACRSAIMFGDRLLRHVSNAQVARI